MDAYTLVGVKLLGGLLVTAVVIVALVMFANVPWWAGLIVLAIADAAEIVWAYFVFKRMRTQKV